MTIAVRSAERRKALLRTVRRQRAGLTIYGLARRLGPFFAARSSASSSKDT